MGVGGCWTVPISSTRLPQLENTKHFPVVWENSPARWAQWSHLAHQLGHVCFFFFFFFCSARLVYTPPPQSATGRAGGRVGSATPSSVATRAACPWGFGSNMERSPPDAERLSILPVSAFRNTTLPSQSIDDPVATPVARRRTEDPDRIPRNPARKVPPRGRRISARRSANSASSVAPWSAPPAARAGATAPDRRRAGAASSAPRARVTPRSFTFTASCREISAKIRRATETAATRRLAPASVRCLPRGGAAARVDVLLLEPGRAKYCRRQRRAIPRAAVSSEPRSRKLRVAAGLVPLDCPGAARLVHAVPFEVVEPLHQPIDARLEVTVADRDPVADADPLGDLRVRNAGNASGTMRLFSSTAWSTSCSQNGEATESGLITKTNPSLPSTALRSAAGNTFASRIPSTSNQTSLPTLRRRSTSRLTSSESLRGSETKTSAKGSSSP